MPVAESQWEGSRQRTRKFPKKNSKDHKLGIPVGYDSVIANREYLTAMFAGGARGVVTLKWDTTSVTGRNRLAQGLGNRRVHSETSTNVARSAVLSHCLSIIGGGPVTPGVNG